MKYLIIVSLGIYAFWLFKDGCPCTKKIVTKQPHVYRLRNWYGFTDKEGHTES